MLCLQSFSWILNISKYFLRGQIHKQQNIILGTLRLGEKMTKYLGKTAGGWLPLCRG